MKTIIETNETDLTAVQFKKSNKITNWEYLSRAEQIKVLNAFSAYYGLFSKFLKPEQLIFLRLHITVTDTRSFNTKIYKEMKKLKTKVSDMAEEKLRVSDVRQRLYITKTRWGVYEVLNEQQYERKLIYG